MQRRALLFASAVGTLARPAIAQTNRAAMLRFVPQAPLTALDPGFTNANNTRAHGSYVFDTLYGIDSQLRPKPQMAEGHTVSEDGRTWRIRLREGLLFHDGTPVRAVDCAASLRRWAALGDAMAQVVAPVVEAWEAEDDRTLRVLLRKPFRFLLDAISAPTGYVPFIMPARIAEVPPGRQAIEMIGSGPYRFAAGEFDAGSRAVYTRFDRYVPRSELADWSGGSKEVFFDRVEWVGITDASTAAAALQAGEVDWWEQASADLIPLLRRNRKIAIDRTDPLGFTGILRFNTLTPPFNKPLMRRAIMAAVNQPDYMGPVTGGDPNGYQICHSLFPCGTPYGLPPTPDPMRETPELDVAKRMIREAGYAGEKIVIINPTEFPSITPFGQVTHDLLLRLGVNSELVETDWGSVLQRRNNRGPVEQGGWSIFHSWVNGSGVFNPVSNLTIRGLGERGWAGWYGNPAMEELVNAWIEAPDPAEQARLAASIQTMAMTDVPTVPLGQFFINTAYRRDLIGVKPAPTPFPWGIRRA
jgi:peptide/nickel transport system substrate-binding protein